MKYNLESLTKKLKDNKNLSLSEVQKDKIDNITDIKIDRRKNSRERILDFISKTKNPYFFKVNGKIVQISFSDTRKTADDCLTNVLKDLYKCLPRPVYYPGNSRCNDHTLYNLQAQPWIFQTPQTSCPHQKGTWQNNQRQEQPPEGFPQKKLPPLR